MTKSPGLCTKNAILFSYKISAKRRKYEWAISDEEALALMELACHYCGKIGSMTSVRNGGSVAWTHNGIDRTRNTEGYTRENSVPCCKRCNTAKGDMEVGEFLAWAKGLLAHQSTG